MLRTLVLTALLGTLVPGTLTGQARRPAASGPALDAITQDVIRSHVRFLSLDLLQGRAPGTPGGQLTEGYIAAAFEQLGLEPAGADGSWFQPVELVGMSPQPSMMIGANRQTMALAHGDDFVAWPEVTSDLVTADGEIVFVGHGIVAPEYGWDDYGGTPLTGRIALVLVNDPGLTDSTVFNGGALTYYGRWTYKLEQAARMGATGVILIHTEESATYPWSVVRGSWTGEQIRLAERPPQTLRFAAWVSLDAARRIMNAAGRDLDAMTRRARQRDFRPIATGAHAVVDLRSRVRRFTASNVVARLPGADSATAGDAVVLTAHHDHVGIGPAVTGDSIYNGAEDNASGVGVLLATAGAVARGGARPPRSIIFVATTAEESGLLGANAYVANPVTPLHRTVAVLNIDVANLRGATDDVGALGAERSTLGAVVEEVARAESLAVSADPEPGRGSFYRSDHFPFARAGVPVVSLRIGTRFRDREANWGADAAREFTARRYHRPADEFSEDFVFEGAVQQARLLARLAWRLAGTEPFPRWSAESEFRAAGQRLEVLRRSPR